MARAMKNSGLEWIGEIPAAWNMAKVSRFFDIQLGKMLQPEASEATDTLEYYLCAANLGGNKLKIDVLKQMWFSESDKAKFNVCKGDLLVVEGGDVASCDVITEDISDLYIQNALHRVRSNIGFDVRLLRYFLIFAKSCGYIDLLCNKATIAHFTKDKFSSIPYPAIPIEEQNSIADFLDTECARIDAVIEQTRASIEEYKKLKQAVITQAVTKGIRPGRKMKDSGIEWIGEIPAAWNMAKVSRFFDIQLGKMLQPEASETTDTLEYYLCAANLGGNKLKIDVLKQMWFSESDKAKFNVCKGDLLVVEGGDVASCDVITEDVSDLYIQNALHRVRSNVGFDVRLLRYFLIFVKSCGYIDLLCNKATIAHFTKDKFSSIPYSAIPIEEQNSIADYLDTECARIEAIIVQKEKLVAELETCKKSLIYEYVTGKKEVPSL